jgi:hypothetical protein
MIGRTLFIYCVLCIFYVVYSINDCLIIAATGTISKSFTKYLSSVPGKHDVKELQKTAVLGTAHTAGSANVEAQKG